MQETKLEHIQERNSRQRVAEMLMMVGAAEDKIEEQTEKVEKKTLYAAEQKRAEVARERRRWMRRQGMF